MPELPEVETVCRLMRGALVGHKLADVEVMPDEIVLSKVEPEVLRAALTGQTVLSIGRRGKFWWIQTSGPALCGHLGMSGWIRELGEPTIRLREHGQAPLDDPEGRPRFLKLLLTGDHGKRVSMTDGRRLSRLWLAVDPLTDPRIAKLGPDALENMRGVSDLEIAFAKRKAPIKALLLDQHFMSGVGNWLADECLYQARIAPARLTNTLTRAEITKLRKKLLEILQFACDVGADKDQFPQDWMFHARWDGKRGIAQIGGHDIVRESVAGRTTAWVPAVQK